MDADLSISSITKATGSKALLGLGSNLGDRIGWLYYGLARLGGHSDIRIEAVSSIWSTPPVQAAGGEFFNIAVRINTSLSAKELLCAIKGFEVEAGRSGSANDARRLDIDIIYFGDLIVDEPSLTIPHPRRLMRSFVLAPLAEVCETAVDPVFKMAISQLAHLKLPGLIPTATRVLHPGWFVQNDGSRSWGEQDELPSNGTESGHD